MTLQKSDYIRTEKHLKRDVWKAWKTYNMIEDGDKVMVCLSGGKDSYTMLDMLLHYQKESDIEFSIVAVNLDQKQPGFPEEILPNYLSNLGVEFKIVEKDTYSIVVEKTLPGQTMCSLCSRLRRGNLYTMAKDLGATKIALGHHRDDALETFFMNLFNGAKLETMPAKYKTDNGEHIVIRPLIFCKEQEIEVYAEGRRFPIIPCTLCGSQENMMRKKVKKMIKEWDEEFPGRSTSVFNAMKNVKPSHLLDSTLYDFDALIG
ncbi:MAG: tRNA 2-thiocytidine(32) synthetase TtcA [Crocinitomicaceae bacterium]|jgi:tRNA 2-thiocytidine biosynthesis protein TtcA|nr:tRNA 2-thiocytidine(32) synthetase TtcA [Crocinitomicaceae bacterium]MDG2464407.1 tRNA 2-thiocytidine(32) synthetase TtcA [Crocinitomicaceae bacterium]